MTNQLLYRKIEETIRERISNGVYPPGSQLPTEMELIKEFNTSRLTIGKSLSHLVAEGLITRTRGRGSFVNGEKKRETPGLIRYISPVASDENFLLHNRLLEGVQETVRKANYNVSIDFYRSAEEETEILRHYKNSENDAFVIWPGNDPQIIEILKELAGRNFPFVLVDSFFPQLKCNCVMTDNILGGLLVLEHLARLGHRRVGYLSQPLDRFSLAERFAGTVSAAGSLGIELLPHTFIQRGTTAQMPLPAETVKAEIARWLDSQLQLPEPPTAIFCSNDSLALTLYEILTEKGIKIPEEMSVAGFDNASFGQYLPIPLTSVEHDFCAIGREAGKILLNLLQKSAQTAPQLHYRIAPQLHRRGSTEFHLIGSEVSTR